MLAYPEIILAWGLFAIGNLICQLQQLILLASTNVNALLSQKFDKDWMIGRVVGKKTALGFLPTESRLREVVAERNATQLGDGGRSVDELLVSLLAPPLLVCYHEPLMFPPGHTHCSVPEGSHPEANSVARPFSKWF